MTKIHQSKRRKVCRLLGDLPPVDAKSLYYKLNDQAMDGVGDT